jgi:hypothetical protein
MSKKSSNESYYCEYQAERDNCSDTYKSNNDSCLTIT